MAVGPGKYDDLCTLVREKAQAQLVIVAVGGGNRGSGFSIQTTDPSQMLLVAKSLRNIADQIEADHGVN